MKKMFRQILYDLRNQPVIGIVSVIGTALALMLVMVSTVVYEVDYAPVAPESNRDRLLYDGGMFIRCESKSSCSGLSLHAIDRLYRCMKTPVKVAAVMKFFEPIDVSVPGGTPLIIDYRRADAEMWNIFDHTFISGSPFTEVDVKAGRAVAVIDESTARALFKTTDVVDREILVRGKLYRIRGVIRDTSPLMKWSYAQMWLPVIEWNTMVDDAHTEMFGGYGAVLMGATPADVPVMKKEAREINDGYNREIKPTGYWRVDCGAPYTQLELSQVHGSNNPPDMADYYLLRGVLTAVFLLVPAINLSSMTRSRLRRRRHEIGVRRAFGATRSEVLLAVLRENFVVTLIGGVIGLVLSMVALWMFADTFFSVDTWNIVSSPVRVSGEMLFRWSTFGWALLFCFVLNLLSAGIPAWRASRLNPVEAINQVED